jgi:hypothetical protein
MNDIIDMSRFVEAKSDQLNADDLIGSPRTITVTRVTGCDGDQPIAIHYQGDGGKPFKPCKTMRRVLLAVWGRNAANYVGRSMTLYRDDSVTFGGLAVGGIRISNMSHIDKKMIVVAMKSKGKKAPIEVMPLAVEQPAPQADPAQRWADAYTKAVAGENDPAALDAFASSKAVKLAELETKRPDLHGLCTAALQLRREQLTPVGDDEEVF